MKTVHREKITVRWGDMDAVGHVNNAKYLTYFEQARVGWLESLVSGAMSRSQGPVMANVACEFKRAIVYPATVIVEVALGSAGRSSLPTGYRIVDADDPAVEYATGSSTLVWVDYGKGGSVALPEMIRELAE
jgi:acyl-CoA thioester hydrolase